MIIFREVRIFQNKSSHQALLNTIKRRPLLRLQILLRAPFFFFLVSAVSSFIFLFQMCGQTFGYSSRVLGLVLKFF